MLVLIATNDLQGTVDGDYAWTVEGELVTPVATECASGERVRLQPGLPRPRERVRDHHRHGRRPSRGHRGRSA